MAKTLFLILIFSVPFSLQAQVYRCDTSQGSIYSQLPCEENAERLVQYDPAVKPALMESESASEYQPSAMENFVTTLENQREAQLIDIDERVSQLKGQLTLEGEEAPEEMEREAMQSEVKRLENERVSINEQYAALIDEAQSRAVSADIGN